MQAIRTMSLVTHFQLSLANGKHQQETGGCRERGVRVLVPPCLLCFGIMVLREILVLQVCTASGWPHPPWLLRAPLPLITPAFQG